MHKKCLHQMHSLYPADTKIPMTELGPLVLIDKFHAHCHASEPLGVRSSTRNLSFSIRALLQHAIKPHGSLGQVGPK